MILKKKSEVKCDTSANKSSRGPRQGGEVEAYHRLRKVERQGWQKVQVLMQLERAERHQDDLEEEK